MSELRDQTHGWRMIDWRGVLSVGAAAVVVFGLVSLVTPPDQASPEAPVDDEATMSQASDSGASGEAITGDSSGVSVAGSSSLECTPDASLVQLPDVPEASGVTASLKTPGLVWINSDTPAGVLFAVNAEGKVVGNVRVPGIKARDWEDVSVGKCDGGSCLYIGDIGDNQGDRKDITVYRMVEPAPGGPVSGVQTFGAVYPDGAHDAEAMWVTDKREVFIVTKGEKGSIAVFRFPADARNRGTAKLKSVVTLVESNPKRSQMVTDADRSPDGKWVVMRSNDHLYFYRAAEIEAGRAGEPLSYDLTGLKEPQGEGVTFGEDGKLYLVSEGGTTTRPGTLTTLQCELPS